MKLFTLTPQYLRVLPPLLTVALLVVASAVTPPARASGLPPYAVASRFGLEVNATKVTAKKEGKPITASEENICTPVSGDICQSGAIGQGAAALDWPGAIAIDEASGNVYVADTRNNRVDEFSRANEFIAAFGWGVATGAAEFQVCHDACQTGLAGGERGQFSGPEGIAIDNSGGPLEGDIYIANTGAGSIQVLSGSGAFIGQITQNGAPQAFGAPDAVAVNTSGDVYVADAANATVDEFAPTEGTSGSTTYGYVTQITSEAMTEPTGIAVDATGEVYVDNAHATVLEFEASGALRAELAPNEARNVAVDAETNAIYVLTSTAPVDIDVYEPATATLIGSLSAGDDGIKTKAAQGITVDDDTESIYNTETSVLKVTINPVTNEEEEELGSDAVELAPAPLPGATTGGAQHVEEESAVLTGSVEPGGFVTAYFFEYGIGEDLGDVAPVTAASAGGGYGPTGVEVALTGLHPGTKYYYRLAASNEFRTRHGETLSFTTALHPPTVTAGLAANVGHTSAQLSGQVNPEGNETTYSFTYVEAAKCGIGNINEYGDGYCATTTVPHSTGNAGSATSAVQVAAQLIELEPHTKYYYDVAANSVGGTVSGMPREFTTVAAPPEVRTLGAGEVTSQDGMVYGAVDPQGSQTTYEFQYGPTSSYGYESPTYGRVAGEGEAFIDVSTTLTGLESGGTYHYRIVATNNEAGLPQTTYGEDETFTTAVPLSYALVPTASTSAASNVTQSGATLNGSIGDVEAGPTALFEYGPTAYYEAAVSASGEGLQGAISVSATISGLRAGTTYHYRLVVNGPGGTAYGEDMTFTSSSVPATPSTVPRAPTPSLAVTHPTKNPKQKMNAQKFREVLRQCHKLKAKQKRARCERTARSRYGHKPKKHKAKRERGRK